MPDLSNDALWYPVFEGSISITGQPTRENKIPDKDLIIPFIGRYFRAYVSTPNQKWYYGGRITLNVGSIGIHSPIYATTRKLILRRWALLDFPLIEQGGVNSQFHLVYEPPWWFGDLNLAIFQYQE